MLFPGVFVVVVVVLISPGGVVLVVVAAISTIYDETAFERARELESEALVINSRRDRSVVLHLDKFWSDDSRPNFARENLCRDTRGSRSLSLVLYK